MSDYIMRGTKRLIQYAKDQGLDMSSQRDRIAAAIGIPVINLTGSGKDTGSFVSKKYNEAQAQALVAILGAENAAAVTTNTGQEVVG